MHLIAMKREVSLLLCRIVLAEQIVARTVYFCGGGESRGWCEGRSVEGADWTPDGVLESAICEV